MDRKQFPPHLELIALTYSKGVRIKQKKRKGTDTWLISSGPQIENSFHVGKKVNLLTVYMRVCIKGILSSCSILMLHLCPKMTSSAEELWHKHTNKHKGTGLSVEVAINPWGKKLQFVVLGRRTRHCLLLNPAQSVLPVSWAWCLWFFKIDYARYDILLKGEQSHWLRGSEQARLLRPVCRAVI